MSRPATEPATRLAVLLVFVIFCLRLPLLLVPLISSLFLPSLLFPLSSHAALLLSCLCAPHKTINLLLQNRCALFPFAGASFSLPADDALTHTHPYKHTHARRQQSALVCIARSRFVGFVIIVGSSLGAMPTRQQAFQLAIWLWRWLCHCPKGLGGCRGWQGGVALSLRGG